MNCKKATSSEFLDVLFNSATTGFCSKMYPVADPGISGGGDGN
jgi:hypothetical protein